MKIFGVFLIFIGGLIEFIQLIFFFTNMDFETFKITSIIGTVLFFIGLGICGMSDGANKI